MRLFLAINLASEVREAIAAAVSPLREAAPDLKWAAAARLHLTLKFLGEQPEAAGAAVGAAMDAVVPQHFAFDMHVGAPEPSVGAFPNFRRPRVVWIGVAHDPRLELLHHDVEVMCHTLGFDLEGRPFRPHVTLARVAGRIDATILRRLERAAKRVKFSAESAVDSVDLMKSVPGPKAAYEQLHASRLRTQ